MYDSKPYYYGTGRRKSSVARVHLFEGGNGTITKMVEELKQLPTLRG